MYLAAKPLDQKSVRAVGVDRGQRLTTQTSEAEILLTAGVSVRLEDSSYGTMISSGLTNTKMSLDCGEALVEVAEIHPVVSDGERSIKVKSGHLVDLATSGPIKAQKFDQRELEAEALYRWTSLCSGYLAEANVDYAANYSFGANGWFGERWYWNPSFSTYTSLPGDGIFLRPFGWRFYSSRCLYAAPSTTVDR